MSFMTYVLVSEENILTPDKAFVSLTLFNIIRMPMTSTFLYFTFKMSITSFHFPYSVTFILFISFFFFSSSYTHCTVCSG